MPKRLRGADQAVSVAGVALDYTRAGLSVVPTGADKIPIISGWKERQAKIPDEATVIEEFSKNGARIAIVAGQVSGNLECIDFDLKGNRFKQWCDLVDKDAPGLIEKLLIQQTPSTGLHILYKCREARIPGNSKLAFEKISVSGPGEHEYEGKKYTAVKEGEKYFIKPCSIETRGEGGYFLAAPSPGYVIKNQLSLTQVPEITATERNILIEAARALNQWIPEPRQPTPARMSKPGELSPGDDFNQRGDIQALLMENGWQFTGRKTEGGEHWRRPGKDRGQSATLFSNGNLYVFSTNAAPFESEISYSPFGIYTCLKHNGDFNAAARELSRQGYGTKIEYVDEATAEREAIQAESEKAETSKNQETGNSRKDERWHIITLADIQAREIEDKPIIRGLLYEADPTVIHAEGGAGKSIITQDIAMALACAMHALWGMFLIPQPRASIFIQSENTLSSINQRVRKKCKGNPDYLLGLSNIAFPYLHENIMAAGYMEDKNFRLQIIDFAKRVEDQTFIKVGLLVFDPLISFHHDQENENVAMRKTLDHIQNDIAIKIDATPIVIHHDNRQGEFRGASAIRDWARNMIKLQGYLYKGQKRIKLIHEKCNNHEMFEPFTLKMDEYLNFEPLEDFELIPAAKRKQCEQVRKSLEMLGGQAQTKGQLAAQYKEIAGFSKQTCFNHIDIAVEHDFIKCEAYQEGSIQQHRYFIQVEGV